MSINSERILHPDFAISVGTKDDKKPLGKVIEGVNFSPNAGEPLSKESPYETEEQAAIKRGEISSIFKADRPKVIVLGQTVAKWSPHETAEDAEAARGVRRKGFWE